MKYFETINQRQDISKEQKTASSFYNFSPILLQVPVLNKNPPWKIFPHKTSCHELDIGQFYSSCFGNPLQSYRAPSILYVKSSAITWSDCCNKIILLYNWVELSACEACEFLMLVLTSKLVMNNKDEIQIVCIIFKTSMFYMMLFT